MSLDAIKEQILKSKKIGITFHTSPDGDAVGSTLALLNILRYLKKDAYMISKDEIPDYLSFLNFSSEIDGKHSAADEETDLLMVLDCGNVERISADFENYKGFVINLDHHISNEYFGNINFVDPEAAATCELVFLLAEKLGIDFNQKNKEFLASAECIYTGIVTDTGSFRHSNVTKRTHEIAGKLIEAGVNSSKIHSSLFDNKPFEKVQLMGEVLSNIELKCNNRISIMSVPLGLPEKFGIENPDTSDIVSIGLGIKGIEVAVVLKETENGTKISLRSKNEVDVRKIAEIFGGGGHIKAAGLMMKNTDIKSAKQKITEAAEKVIKETLTGE